MYESFLDGINVITLDVGWIFSAGCVWSDIDFHDRLLTSTLWPLALLGLLAITYVIAVRRNSACCETKLENIRHKHLSALLLLSFLVYSSVSSTVFQTFACDSLDDGESYLRADYRILCTDTKHKRFQAYAGIMIVVYPVGIPPLYSFLLYRHREVLSNFEVEKSTAQPISDLWEPFRPNVFYYGVIECGRRVLLTGVVVFIFPNDAAQIAITVINSFFFVVFEVLSPYKYVSDAWLSRSGHIIVLISMFDALLLKVDVSEERSESQNVFGGVLVAVNVLLILAIVVEAIFICYASRRQRQVEEISNPSQSSFRRRLGASIGQEEAAVNDSPRHPASNHSVVASPGVVLV